MAGRVGMASGRVHWVIRATLGMLRRRCAGRLWQALLGHWGPILQFRRCLYSVLQATFAFVHEMGPNRLYTAPAEVRGELLILCLVAGDAFCDLRAPIARTVLAADGSLSGGGLCEASLPAWARVAL